MRSSRFFVIGLVGIGLAGCTTEAPNPATIVEETPAISLDQGQAEVLLAKLGGSIFADENLSLGRNQACRTCHSPAWGFSSPNPTINAHGAVMQGSVAGRFATRRPPSAAYATQAPVRFFDDADGTYVGGNFWDGRATGDRLGSPSAEQAQLPFVGPNEQALPDRACVIHRIAVGKYAKQWTRVYGGSINQIVFPPETNTLCSSENTSVPLSPTDRSQIDIEYDRLALAIAAFEASSEVNQFDSKYDAFLAGKTTLSPLEQQGLELFEGKANCAACHPSQGAEALFTDYTYDNIGIPANTENPQLVSNPSFRDLGIGGVTNEPSEWGKQKVPTLRNMDKRANPKAAKSFMHNGALRSLEQVVHFYNTRDVLPNCADVAQPRFAINCWPAPEVLENVNVDELGNLGLTVDEERAVVAFLKTLSDGWSKKPY